MSNTISYRVQGLDCAEEISVLRARLEKRAGIEALAFDILNERMTVTFDPTRVETESIVAGVAEAGMSAVLWQEQDEERPAESAPRESIWRRHGRLIMAGASGGLLVIGFLVHWILHGSFMDALLSDDMARQHSLPYAVILFYLGSIIAGAWFVALKAVTAARNLRADMNLLMSIAVIGALAIGQWFEAATVAFLFSVALMLEQWSIGRARRAITKVLDISPRTARTICPHDGDIEEKRVEAVKVGTIVVVRPHDRIPLDGEVTAGETTVNQAPITGESLPVHKGPGDEVFAGTINEDGAIELRVTKEAKDTTLSRIIHLVQEAQKHRAPSQRWVDQFAEYYTPAVILLAALVLVIPPLVLGGSWSEYLYRSLVVLVISCPCALVISTPVSIVSGLASAARNGILIKGGMFLEAAGGLRAICLDKTGTLTHGRPEVQEIIPFSGHSVRLVLEKAAALEAHSQHPLARAIMRKAEAEGVKNERAKNFQAIPGKGAYASFAGRLFWIGSHRLMDEKGQETPEVHAKAEELEDAGHSVVAIGNNEHVCGLISVADGVREKTRETLATLKKMGVEKIVMLTGDNEGTARAVALASGIDEFHYELLPEDKLRAVEKMVRDYGQVAMVGDGVNDAPAMAASSFGIAMASMGTDAAIETADIALMSDELHKIPWLIAHSRRTFSIVKQNIIFALGTKGLFLSLAMVGLATLWMAVAADMGVSILVIFNGLRLLRQRGEEVHSSQ